MTDLDSIWKSRDISFPTKVLHSQSCGFSSSHVQMWELDHKKGWGPKNWCFWTLWYWRRLLRVSWTARRSNQSILKKINLEYSLEELMLKLKLQYLVTWCKALTHWKRPWFWERLKAGEGDDRGWDDWMVSSTQWKWVWVNSKSRQWTGRPGMLQSMRLQRVGYDWVTELNWITKSIKTLKMALWI